IRRTLASPNFATSSNKPPAICGEVLSASISTANRGNRCCSVFIAVSRAEVAGEPLGAIPLIPEKVQPGHPRPLRSLLDKIDRDFGTLVRNVGCDLFQINFNPAAIRR